MMLSIALACLPANTTLAHWQYTYAHSGNLEDDRVYTSADDLYYVQRALDRATGALTGPARWHRMRCDNVRDVTMSETSDEIAVQVWGIRNTSVLVLHFTKAQRELARAVTHRLERLALSAYLPMQKRAKMPPSSSSVTASPVS